MANSIQSTSPPERYPLQGDDLGAVFQAQMGCNIFLNLFSNISNFENPEGGANPFVSIPISNFGSIF